MIGTDSGDGGNVDCYVITTRILKTGQIVECDPIGLMEQFEDGVEDHNILARLLDEPVVINEGNGSGSHRACASVFSRCRRTHLQ